MYCIKCGKEIPEGKNLCNSCKQRINKVNEETRTNNLKNKIINNKKFFISLLVLIVLTIFIFILVNSNNSNSKVNKALESEAISCAQDLKDNRLFSFTIGTEEEFEIFEIKWSANSSGQRLIFIDAQTDPSNRAIYAYIDGEYVGSDNLADMSTTIYNSQDEIEMVKNSKQIKETWKNSSNEINVENILKELK